MILAQEIVFEQTFEVHVLESVLLGDARCRFAIRLPSGALALEAENVL
jgi:hypothetical protein